MPLTELPENRQSPDPEVATTAPAQDNSTIGRMKRIVSTKETAQIGGLNVDFLTARTVIRVYERLSERKREKFVHLTPKQMVHKAFELDK